MKVPSKKIVSREVLAEIIQDLKRRGSIIVTTNGSFDLLHIGHVTMLQEAKSLGDVLIVGMNSDASVRRYKGKYRPICSQNHRAEMLAALECTDYITIFDESTPIEFLKVVQPDIHVNSPEHGHECIEREVVEQHGGRIHLACLIEEMSTTQLLQRILDASSHEPGRAIFLNPADLAHENQEDTLNTLKQFQEMGFQLFLLEHPELTIVNCQLNPPLRGVSSQNIQKTADDYNISLAKSFIISSEMKNIQMGREVNCKTILLKKPAKYEKKENGISSLGPNYTAENFQEAIELIKAEITI
jgi:rfaE bifunctional protein nucleotidyltransferase chain/domain